MSLLASVFWWASSSEALGNYLRTKPWVIGSVPSLEEVMLILKAGLA